MIRVAIAQRGCRAARHADQCLSSRLLRCDADERCVDGRAFRSRRRCLRAEQEARIPPRLGAAASSTRTTTRRRDHERWRAPRSRWPADLLTRRSLRPSEFHPLRTASKRTASWPAWMRRYAREDVRDHPDGGLVVDVSDG